MNLSFVMQIVTLVAQADACRSVHSKCAMHDASAATSAHDDPGITVRPDHIAASYAILDLAEYSPPPVIENAPEVCAHANTLMNSTSPSAISSTSACCRCGPSTCRSAASSVLSGYACIPASGMQRAAHGLENTAVWFPWIGSPCINPETCCHNAGSSWCADSI